MKKTKRFIVAVVLVVLLSITAVSVWAASSRVGTVPVLPAETTGSLTDTVNFGTGTVTVNATSSDGGTLTVKKVDNPGAAPSGWNFLLNQSLDISITGGTLGSVQVCVPQSPDIDDTATFHYWNAATNAWVAIPTAVTTGTPPMVCGTGSAEGQYSLMGK